MACVVWLYRSSCSCQACAAYQGHWIALPVRWLQNARSIMEISNTIHGNPSPGPWRGYRQDESRPWTACLVRAHKRDDSTSSDNDVNARALGTHLSFPLFFALNAVICCDLRSPYHVLQVLAMLEHEAVWTSRFFPGEHLVQKPRRHLGGDWRRLRCCGMGRPGPDILLPGW